MSTHRAQDSPTGPSGASPPGRDRAGPALIRGEDVYLLGYLASMTTLSWCLPERYWIGAVSGFERLLWRARQQPRPGKRGWLDRIARLIGDFPVGMSPEDILRRNTVLKHVANLQLLRCHRPGGWRPRLRLAGDDRLRQALDAGRGAILWTQPTEASHLVAKMAFHRAGFRVIQLSRFGHGFSDSLFGWRLLNPIRVSVENRYLAERLVMGPEGPFVPGAAGPVRAVEALSERLAAGGVVSIMVVAAQARKPRHMPFLNGVLPVGDGAIRLARRTGAALFPVFVIRGPDGTFTTTVEPELKVPAAGDDDSAAEEVLGAFGRLLESYVLRAPEQFSLWYEADPSPDAPT